MAPQWKAICKAFDVASNVPDLQNVWLCDETFARSISTRYPELIKLSSFNAGTLNAALGRMYGSVYELFDQENDWGVYSIKFFTQCPYDSSKMRHVQFY